MKIYSWNVNGIRSVFAKSFPEWLKTADPDIVCLQEIKADGSELSEEFNQVDGYYAYFNSSARKKGHSGVAVYTKVEPLSIETKLGIERFDEEGRCLKLTFKDFILFNLYIPNGGRDKHDIPYKLEVYKRLFPIFESLADKKVILTGDFNIAHTELDVFYAKQNYNNTMFTPEERKQIDTLVGLGYIDTFRHIYPDKKAYTWWPYRADLRERDVGWRIDYVFVSQPLVNKVKDTYMEKEVGGSDHCPYGVVLNKPVKIRERPVYTKVETKPSLF